MGNGEGCVRDGRGRREPKIGSIGESRSSADAAPNPRRPWFPYSLFPIPALCSKSSAHAEGPMRTALAVPTRIDPHVVLPQGDFGEAVADPGRALFTAGAGGVALAAVGAEVAVVL